MRETQGTCARLRQVWVCGGVLVSLAVSAAQGANDYIDNTGSCANAGPSGWIACEDFDDYAKSGWLSAASVAEPTNKADWVTDTICPKEWQVFDDRPASAPHNVRVQKNANYPTENPPPGLGARNLLSLVPRIHELDPAKGAVNGTDDDPLELYFEAYPATSAQLFYRQNFIVELNNGLDVAPAQQITTPCPHILREDGTDHGALAFGVFAQTDPQPCATPEEDLFVWYDGDEWKTLEAGGVGNLNDQLITINTTTGVGTLVATIAPAYQTTTGLAFDPGVLEVRPPTLYCSVKDNGGRLIKINPADGAATDVGPLSDYIHGLAFDPDTETLYGSNTGNNYLVSINTSNGQTTNIGHIASPTSTLTAVEGLAFDPNTNTLYGVATGPNPDQVITINTTTGSGTLLGEGNLFTHESTCRDPPDPPDPDQMCDHDLYPDTCCPGGCPEGKVCVTIQAERFNSVHGLEFDSVNNKLYATDTAKNELIIIDTHPAVWQNGDAWDRVYRPDNRMGYPLVEGLAFDPTNPPGTGTMYGINNLLDPPEDVSGSYAWNKVTVLIKTSTMEIHLQNKDVGSPFVLTVPRTYVGGFARLAIGNSGCISSPYTMDLDTMHLNGGVLTATIYPSGACCLAGACEIMDEDICAANDGEFGGPGSTCDEVNCCPDPFADADFDGDVDQEDFAELQACFVGSGGPAPTGQCVCFDRDDDHVIDEDDWTQFEICATGPDIPFDYNNRPPGCTP